MTEHLDRRTILAAGGAMLTGGLMATTADAAAPKLTVKSETTADGVTERLFELTVAGEKVPGLLWTPAGAKGPRPLVLIGHGGSLNKKVGALRGKRYAQAFGYATAAIDAPGHGDRVPAGQPAALLVGPREGMWERMNAVVPQAVAEWRATLSALQALPEVGAGKVGYWGVSMGSGIGIPFVAEEPRVTAAVFGLTHQYPGSEAFMAAARKIAVPVEFVCQWDDEIATRKEAIAVYDAFASKEKALHFNPGGHVQIPPYEAASWEAFYARHLGKGAEA